MVTVLNRRSAPVVCPIAGSESIHLLARETREITYVEFQSDSVKEHIEAGFLLVLRME